MVGNVYQLCIVQSLVFLVKTVQTQEGIHARVAGVGRVKWAFLSFPMFTNMPRPPPLNYRSNIELCLRPRSSIGESIVSVRGRLLVACERVNHSKQQHSYRQQTFVSAMRPVHTVRCEDVIIVGTLR
jgi:hypothetical protein